MKIGFSLTPGGLLLPYHLEALDALKYNGLLRAETPIAGSSAGAIATACHGCQLDSKLILDATIEMSDTCASMGGARGRLLPLLRDRLSQYIGDEQLSNVQQREGAMGIAYREIFPTNQSFLQTEFATTEELMDAVCHSSMFPFFSTNWPVAVDTSRRIPRLMVDGFFTVSRDRFGAPDFAMGGIDVDRTVAISVFPKDAIGMAAFTSKDCISPTYSGDSAQLENLVRLATKPSSGKELTALYESGFQDAERWCRHQTGQAAEQSKSIHLSEKS
ncbi:predicted protein [Phaeodactylum tricornutum CCAP 1055/1]|jgi:hypothetical protein|uniref:PNPLA domain-containing protein n=1 Tax=Phaeodactylum tricornutum (strain CCAP 1055/1) TaxID=556484 RepID=B7FT33_PHATC|nr:predicted protein [Phaeodactylum tricornutum CCAP 1055/1]EEC50581.1 predicted protein [Phaeodactylum tricornutum CCAP 1055/1]|eukprot:XP_002177767.1 predicted protein [Phaeodactylum tricornutum CCAP 1055/1]